MKKLILLCCISLYAYAGISQIEKGVFYFLKNVSHSTYLHSSTNNDAAVMVESADKYSGSAAFQFVPQDNGNFIIRSQATGLLVGNKNNPGINMPLNLVYYPNDGATWSISAISPNRYLIKNTQGGFYLSSWGNPNPGAAFIQANQTDNSIWELIKTDPYAQGPVMQLPGASPQQASWVESSLPSKYFGAWKIMTVSSARNDMYISSQMIMDGSMEMQIVKIYFRDGVYKVITTLNNYYQTHYIMDRTGGIGNGGISINNINRHAFRSQEEANNFPQPGEMDRGYR